MHAGAPGAIESWCQMPEITRTIAELPTSSPRLVAHVTAPYAAAVIAAAEAAASTMTPEVLAERLAESRLEVRSFLAG
jgi:hypothetical protein